MSLAGINFLKNWFKTVLSSVSCMIIYAIDLRAGGNMITSSVNSEGFLLDKTYNCIEIWSKSVCASPLRHDWSEDTSAKIQWGQNGQWERNSASALKRNGNRSGSGELLIKLPWWCEKTLNALNPSHSSLVSLPPFFPSAQWIWREGHQDGWWSSRELHGHTGSWTWWDVVLLEYVISSLKNSLKQLILHKSSLSASIINTEHIPVSQSAVRKMDG